MSKKIILLNRKILESFNPSDKSAIVRKFTDAGLEILGADFGFAWLREHDGGEFKLAYKSARTPYQPNLPRKHGDNQTAQEKQQPVFISEVKPENYETGHDVSPYMQSYVVIPICFNNFIYGNLVICYEQSHNFSEEDQGLAAALGNATAQAITINRLMLREQEARMESEAQCLRFKAMIENSRDVFALLNEKGEIIDISNSAAHMSGYNINALLGRKILEFVHLDDVEKIHSHIQKTLEQTSAGLTVEVRYRHFDGSWRWLEASGINKLDDPNVKGIIANIRDITQRKEAENIIKKQAQHDVLTGLPNRDEFSVRFSQALEQAKRNNHKLAIMFVDIDRFKTVNARYPKICKLSPHRYNG